jgi:uncharacterized membrane protein YkvA (DUF1232 family)
MAEKKPANIIIPSQGGVWRDLVLRIKLIARLMRDQRVNFFLKLLPVASLVYLIWPADLLPGLALPVIGALDDAAVLWLGSYLFLELAPPNVVQEHLKQLSGNLEPQQDDEVVEGETTDVTDKPE